MNRELRECWCGQLVSADEKCPTCRKSYRAERMRREAVYASRMESEEAA